MPRNGTTLIQYSPSNIIFNNSPIVMKNIMSPSIPEYAYLYGQGVKEPLIIDGWELLLVNLGYYPDNVTIIPATADDNIAFPYIVLYNRYSGIIRVYTNFGTDSDAGQGGNAMTITVGFESDELGPFSGVFRLYNGYDQALNKPTEVFFASAIVPKPSLGSDWASADFQVAYDPCTCYNLSRLAISIKSHVNSQVELHGRSISTPQNLTNGSSINPAVNDFISNFEFNNLDDKAEDGIAIYKTMNALINDYIGKLEAYQNELVAVGRHNEKVARNLMLLKAGKIVFAALVAPSVGAAAATKVVAASATDQAVWNTLMAFNEGYTSLEANGDKVFKTDNVIKAVKVIFGEAGKTFIANNFETQNLPSPPTSPTVTLEEMFYSGTISTTGNGSSVSFYSPGAYGGVVTPSNPNPAPTLNSLYEYPVYNEVMGTFALLRSPRIKISKTIKDEVVDSVKQLTHFMGVDCPDCGNLIIRTQRYQSWTTEYQVSLYEDLKYAFNDVLDIKEYEVKAAYNIIAKPNLIGKIPKQNINLFNDSLKAVNIYSTNITVNSMDSILGRGVPYGYYRNELDDRLYELIPDTTDLDRHSVVLDSVKIKTEYIPIDAFKPFTIGFGLKNEVITYNVQGLSQFQKIWHGVDVSSSDACNGCYEVDLENDYIQKPPIQSPSGIGYNYDFKIELKLMVDIVFNTLNSDGVNNTTTLLLTYLIDPNDGQIVWENNDLIPNLIYSSSNYNQYPLNSYFGTTNFGGQQVDNCTLNNNIYTCAALNNLTIDGDISVANGYHVDFKAGNQINVIDESNISPEAVLMIESIYDYSHPMPKATSNEVYNFCQNSNLYKANRKEGKLQNNKLDSLQQDNYSIQQEKKYKQMLQNFDFSMYPNPTTNQANIIIDRLLTEGVTISVKDVAGKTIDVLTNQQNDNTYTIDVSYLESGIYFVTVSTYGYSKTKRLVITK